MRASKSTPRWALTAACSGLVVLLALSSPAFSKPPASKMKVILEPASLVLQHSEDSRHVLVTGIRPDGYRVDLTGKASYTPVGDVVEVDENGYLHPLKVGKTKVRIRVAGQTVELPVTVKTMDLVKISFVRDIMPILSKTGCNAGTCHGAAIGKGGFTLSLTGYNERFDYRTMVEEYGGRRFNRAQPEQSLILSKPAQGVPHAGGLRFDEESEEYRAIRRWIVEGASFDGEIGRATRIEVLPEDPTLRLPGEGQRVLVIAHYPDGSTRDVTRGADYSSSVPDTATVTDWGRVTAERRGESHLLTRYEGRFATTSFTVLGDRTGFVWKPQVQQNYVDELVDAKLQKIKALPAPLATDDEFLRRVYLDLAGLPPSAGQVRAFLKDSTPTRLKRERVIDELLASADYTEHWTNKWADLLQCNRKYMGVKGIHIFRNWIREQVSQNRPYDEFAYELLTATGDSDSNPPAYYYRVINVPETATENITQLFLGIRFSCNKCHDHPFEKWTRDQYYQMAAFFGRVGLKRRGQETLVFDKSSGEITHPEDGLVMQPTPPYVYEGMNITGETRREKLATWLTSPHNPYFAKSYVNRTWSYFTGKGIIDPVDDIRGGNPPSNPALLDALTEDFVQSGFDRRHLMRVICQSRTYQATIRTNKWNEDDSTNFSHALPRRLTAEQLLDSVVQATGSQQKFAGLPAGFRAAQLPDPTVAKGGFLDLFGRPQRETPCECERSGEISLAQALGLINGPTVSDAIIDPKGRLAGLLKKKLSNEQLVEEIYLAALCRFPRAKEKQTSLQHMQSATSKAEGAQDLMWVLINSSSFLFNR